MKADIKETEKVLEADVKTEEKYTDGNVHMEEEENSAEKTDKNTEEAESGKKAGKGMVSTRGGLYLRTVIGGLILYYAYSILSGMQTASGVSRTFLYIFTAVFGIAGVWIILDSLKRLFKKEYDE